MKTLLTALVLLSSAIALAAAELPVVTVTLPDPMAAESGSDPGTIRFWRNTSLPTETVVQFAVSGTATPGSDYAALGTSIVIPANATTVAAVVTPFDDAFSEDSETVIVTIVTDASYTIGSIGTATVTIADNDLATVTVTASDATAAETGGDTGTFTVTRDTARSVPLTVSFTVGGSANSGSDYTSIGTSVVIPANQLSAAVTVTPIDDATKENPETVVLTVSSNGTHTAGSPASATVIIESNEVPTVTVSATDATASEPGTNTGTFRFTRDITPSTATVVVYTVSGTASSGSDFTTLSGTATITGSTSTVDVTLTALDDALVENAETVVVTISASSVYDVGSPSTATVTIADNELPTVTVVATDAAAAETGGDTGMFTVSRDVALNTSLTVDFTVTGSATSASDYTSIGTSVVILANNLSATVTVTPIDDATKENPETVVLTVSTTATQLAGSPASATVTIESNEVPTVTVSTTDATASEPGTNTGTFRFTRDITPSTATVVTYTVGGTATSGSDFTALSGTATISGGATTVDVTLSALDDTVPEDAETVIVTVATSTAYTVGSPSAATVTISDNDLPTVTVTASDATAAETGGDTGTFTVTRDVALSTTLTVTYSVSGSATSGSDFTSIGTSVVIPASQLSTTVTVTPIDDATKETPETVVLTVATNGTHVAGTPASATVTIASNEQPTITVSATDATASEPGTNTGTFRFTRDISPSTATVVSYTVSGTATSGSDFTALSGAATISGGVTTVDVTLTALDNVLPEDAETVVVTIAADATYAVGSPSSATVTISDNDLPTVTVTASDATAAETGGDTGTFTVTRDVALSTTLTVTYSVGGSATSGSDFTSIGTSVVIPANQLSATVTVTPIDDATKETPETVVLTVATNGTHIAGTPASATVTISSNEVPVVTVSATDASASEPGTNTGTFRFTRDISPSTATVVSYTVSGTATSGSDFTALSGTATISGGVTTVDVTLTALDNALPEDAETVIVTVAADATYAVGSPSSATVTISDNDLPTVTVVATDSAAETGVDTGTFVVSRDVALSTSLTVTFAVSGTATSGSDFTSLGTSVVIPANQLSASVIVTPIDDVTKEDPETVVLTVSTTGTQVAGTPASATVVISSNEGPTVTITAIDATASEPGTNTGTFRFTRDISPPTATVVSYTVSGTATSGSDFTALSGTATIPGSGTIVNVTLTALDDVLPEDSETVIVTVSASPSYFLGSPSAATVTISDDDLPTVTIAATDATAAETGGNTGTFTVSRDVALSTSLTVTYSVGGSATSGSDFTSLGTTVVIPANQLSATVTVTPIDDATKENPETVLVTVTTTASQLAGTPASATVTIASDEQPVVTVAATDATASEPGTNTGTFTFTRDISPSTSTVISYSVSGTATSGVDFTTLGGTATITSGNTTTTVTLTALDDVLHEGPETVVVTVAADAAYAVGSPASATVTISDDDLPTVTVVATDPNAAEIGNDTGTFTVSRALALPTSLTVSFTRSGTATSGSDFTSIGTSVVIPANQASATVTVTPINDSAVEDPETIVVTLDADVSYIVGSPSNATVTLISEDLPTITVDAYDALSAESGGVGQFRFNRNASPSTPLAIYFTVSGTATNGTDYQMIGSSATIPSGSDNVLLQISPIDDNIAEDDETVVVVLIASAAYTVGTPDNASVLISDDDNPTITITATDATAAETGGNTGTFTLSRGTAFLTPLTVYYFVSGTADEGVDYANISSTSLTIPANSATATITITPIDDTEVEGTETVTITLDNRANYDIGTPAAATVTIDSDDLPTVTVTATDAAASEPGSNTGNIRFTRSAATGDSLVVHFTVSGTATSGSDFTAIGTTATIAGGSTTANVVLTPINDSVAEDAETVVVTIDADAAYTVGTPSVATVTISDNDLPTITVTATDAAAAEAGLDAGAFTVSRGVTLASSLAVSISMGGTATGGSDYTAITTPITIPGGQSAVVVAVTPIDDAVAEIDETVTLTVTANASLYSIGSPSAATVTITSEDPPAITVTATDAAAAEAGLNTGTFTVSRGLSLPTTTQVAYAVSGTAVAGTDYVTLNGQVTIAANNSTATVTVTPIDDALVELSETVTVTITPQAGYTVGSPAAATVALASDDIPTVTVQVSDAVAEENWNLGGAGIITIWRTGEGEELAPTLTVNYSVTGTATSGSDYYAIGTSYAFSGGQKYADIVVLSMNDASVEDDETVILTLTPNAAYAIGTPSNGTVTIRSDDLPSVTIVATDSSASEVGIGTATFTVTRSVVQASSLQVGFVVSGTAQAGADYVALSGAVTIPANQTSATITVTPIDDAEAEDAETVTLTLQGNFATHVVGTPSVATATIDSNDLPTITVTATDVSAAEAGLDPGQFTVSRGVVLATATTVSYGVSGAATVGSDYTALSGTVVIAAGASSALVPVAPLDDAVVEDPETVILTVSANAAYAVGTPSSATVTITSDDLPTITVTATDAAAAEAGLDPGQFTVSRGIALATATTVTYGVSGTTTAGSDYTTLSGTVVIAAGASSAPVSVTPLNDVVVEDPETIILTVSANAAYTVGTPSTATVTITSDDLPTITVTATDAAAAEADLDPGVFTVSRGVVLSTVTTVVYGVSGTATAGSDYTTLSGTVDIAAGQSSATVPVAVLNDVVVEDPETVILTVSANAAYTVGTPSSATVTITSDDLPTITVTATDAAAAEAGLDPGQFTVSRGVVLSTATTVAYGVSGTATAGSDYTTLSGSVVIPAGFSSAPVSVAPLDDAVVEDPETVILTVSTNAAYAVGSPSLATVTITSDDVPAPTVPSVTTTAVTGITQTSATSGGTVTADGGTSVTARGVCWSTSANPTITDSLTTNGTGTGNFTGVLTGLTSDTPYHVRAYATNSLGTSYGTDVTFITLIDDGPVTVQVVASDPNASEAGHLGTVTFTRTGSLASALPIAFTVTGTASQAVDYVGMGTAATFAAGSATVILPVTVIQDDLQETPESVVVTLGSSENYSLGASSSATVMIADDDVVTIAVSTATTTEGVSPTPAAFIVSRAGSTTNALEVNVAFAGTASAGDYARVPSGGVVTIDAGQTSAQIIITPINDTAAEGNETVIASLAPGSNYTVGTQGVATVTILDDEVPTVTVAATTATASEPSTQGIFTITRSAATSSALDVLYELSGTATVGADYAALTGTVTIAASTTTATVVVVPIADAITEVDESVILTLTPQSTYNVGAAGSATVTIADCTVTIVATDGTAAEPGVDTGTFTITRTGSMSGALVVNVAWEGDATAGTDFSTVPAVTSTVTISSGDAATTVTLTAIGDDLAEGPETASLVVRPGPYACGLSSVAHVVIADATLTIAVEQSVIDEQAGAQFPFIIQRTGDRTSALSVPISFGGTAIKDTDYTPSVTTTSVVMLPNQSQVMVYVTPLPDSIGEGDESITLTLGSIGDHALFPALTATMTIKDDETPTVRIEATDALAGETGPNTGAFTVSRSVVSGSALTVNLTRSGTAIAGTDFSITPTQIGTSLSSNVEIPADLKSIVILVTPVDDGIPEAEETIVITIDAGAGYRVAGAGAAESTLAISDNDASTISVTAIAPEASESGAMGQFLVSRTGELSAITVSLGLSGSAINGTDYAALPLTIVMSAGHTTVPVMIAATNDTLSEGPETVVLTLTAGAGYVVGSSATATVTIADNDQPIVTIAATSPASEGSVPGIGVFTISRTGPTAGALPISLAITGTATSSDYTSTPASVIIADGAGTAEIIISPIDDMDSEGDETIIATLLSSSSYVIGADAMAIMILADDEAPSISIVADDASAGELGSDTGTFVVTRSAVNATSLEIPYSVSGSATAGVDFIPLTGSVTIPAGNKSAVITVLPRDDGEVEVDETVTVTLAAGSAWTLGQPAMATVVIISDDLPAPAVTYQKISATSALLSGSVPDGLHISAITAQSLTSGVATTTLLAPGLFAVNLTTSSAPAATVSLRFIDERGHNGPIAQVTVNFSSQDTESGDAQSLPPAPPTLTITLPEQNAANDDNLFGLKSETKDGETIYYTQNEDVYVQVEIVGGPSISNALLTCSDGSSYTITGGVATIHLTSEGKYSLTASAFAVNDGHSSLGVSNQKISVVYDKTPPRIYYRLPRSEWPSGIDQTTTDQIPLTVQEEFGLPLSTLFNSSQGHLIYLNGNSKADNQALRRTHGWNCFTWNGFTAEVESIDLSGLRIDDDHVPKHSINAGNPQVLTEVAVSTSGGLERKTLTYGGFAVSEDEKYFYVTLTAEDKCGNKSLEFDSPKLWASANDRVRIDDYSAGPRFYQDFGTDWAPSTIKQFRGVAELWQGGASRENQLMSSYLLHPVQMPLTTDWLNPTYGSVTLAARDWHGNLSGSQEFETTNFYVGRSYGGTVLSSVGAGAEWDEYYSGNSYPWYVSNNTGYLFHDIHFRDSDSTPTRFDGWTYQYPDSYSPYQTSISQKGGAVKLWMTWAHFSIADWDPLYEGEDPLNFATTDGLGNSPADSIDLDAKPSYMIYFSAPIEAGPANDSRRFKPAVLNNTPSWISEPIEHRAEIKDAAIAAFDASGDFNASGTLALGAGNYNVGATSKGEGSDTITFDVGIKSLATGGLRSVGYNIVSIPGESANNAVIDYGNNGDWVVTAKLSPDIVSSGSTQILVIESGFVSTEFSPSDFSESGDYVHILLGGKDVSLSQPGSVGKTQEILEQSIVIKRQKFIYNGRTSQQLLLEIQVGGKVLPGMYDVDVRLGAVKSYSDTLSAMYAGANGAHRMTGALAIMKIQDVVKGESGQMVPVNYCYNSITPPSIEVSTTSSSMAVDGTVTVNLHIKVTDRCSDFIDDPQKQLQGITISAPGAYSDYVHLTNSGTPSLPWEPYKFQAELDKNLVIQTGGECDFSISIVTDLNAAGGSAKVHLPVQISKESATIVHLASVRFPSQADANSLDHLQLMRDGIVIGDLTETGVNSLSFTGIFDGGNITVGVPGFSSLSDAIDQIFMNNECIMNGLSITVTNGNVDETGVLTNEFPIAAIESRTGLALSVGKSVSTNNPGNSFAVLCRAQVPEEILGSGDDGLKKDLRAVVFDREWKTKKLNYGDGDFYYIVDGNEKPVVFLPSLLARTHFQTKPIKPGFEPPMDKEWAKYFRITLHTAPNYPVSKQGDILKLNPLLVGLVVESDDASSVLSQYIKNFALSNTTNSGETRLSKSVDGKTVKVYNYIPADGFTYKGTSVTHEIYWKYVSLPNTVVIFNSLTQLTDDIKFRVQMIDSAISAPFYFQIGFRGDPSLWKTAVYQPATKDFTNPPLQVMPGVKISVAIEDFWNAQKAANGVPNVDQDLNLKKYRVSCEGGAILCFWRSVLRVYGPAAFDGTFTDRDMYSSLEKVRDIYEQPDRNFWIPGDWGSVNNLAQRSMKERGLEGENIIYLGGWKTGMDPNMSPKPGCFTKGLEFPDAGMFWGHGVDDPHDVPQSLSAWLRGVASWNNNAGSDVEISRYYFRGR